MRERERKGGSVGLLWTSLSPQSKEPDFLTLLTRYHQQAQKIAQSWDRSAGLGPAYVNYCLQRPTSRLKETGTSLPANVLWIWKYIYFFFIFLVLQMCFQNKAPEQHKACKDEEAPFCRKKNWGKRVDRALLTSYSQPASACISLHRPASACIGLHQPEHWISSEYVF